MLDNVEPTALRTYEFLCQRCPDPISKWLDFEALRHERPVCLACNTELLPNLAHLRSVAGSMMEDIIISPGLAGLWLDRGFESFRSQINPLVVESYTNLMKQNRWVDATKNMGGLYCPIVRINQYLMLGFQRLEACIKANHTFRNTVLSVQ